MIVKNESHVIKRCLQSVLPFIDTWVIVDTGSTDGTQNIIREFLKEIPGELLERPWVNFGHNREEALQLAKMKASYLLFMDADDILKYDKDFQLPPLIHDYYMIKASTNGTDYYLPNIIKASRNWHWHGVLHEYVSANDAAVGSRIQGLEYAYLGDGSRSKDPKKYLKDVEVLLAALKQDPNNGRNTYYLAQSYNWAGDSENALKYHTKRAEMDDCPEEIFLSKLHIARLQDKLGMDAQTVEKSYKSAYFYRPTRFEPLYDLVNKARLKDNFQKGYNIARLALDLPYPNDTLFVETWIYDFGLLFEYSICAYWIGEYQECLTACDKLLKVQNMPKNYLDAVKRNREFAVAKVSENIKDKLAKVLD